MTPDWKGKDLKLIQEASRHGEARIAAQVQIAISADQRAAILAGIYAAAATAIIGVIASSVIVQGNKPLLIGSSVTALTFLIAAVFCLLATLPVEFGAPGNEPQEWYSDIEKGTPLEVAVGEQLAHFNQHILDNHIMLQRNARRFIWGALVGIASPAFGVIIAGIVCLFS